MEEGRLKVPWGLFRRSSDCREELGRSGGEGGGEVSQVEVAVT